MLINTISIKGLRGFTKETKISFAIPDKEHPGSGLTVLVGPNNSGKSTLIEAFHLLSINKLTIPKTSRNYIDDNVFIQATETNGNTLTIESTPNKGAFIQRKEGGQVLDKYIDSSFKAFILTNKRSFASTFNSNEFDRDNYHSNVGREEYRNENNINSNFGGRLLNIYNNRKEFDDCLKKILNPVPDWTIEARDGNNSYLEFSFHNIKHSSKEAGDGYINIFNIIDALYDSSENNVILIDEPEISLHPDLQRKLFNLLVEYSKDKQIIISTHSPYFVDWNVFTEYGKVIRLKKEKDDINSYELTQTTKEAMKKLLKNANNPHILSLNSNEVFFLNDNVILTEGQDDVICYKEIFKQYNFEYDASFFGWGVGGAENVNTILKVLNDLGYRKVFTILDNDKKDDIEKHKKVFPMYDFYAIATNDVHNKTDDKMNKIIKKVSKMKFDENAKNEVLSLLEKNADNKEGLVTDRKNYTINSKYEDDIKCLIDKIRGYFFNDNSSEDGSSYSTDIDILLDREERKAKKY